MSPVVASRRFSPARLLTLLVANLVWLVPMFLAPATNAGAQIVVNSLTDDAPGSAASCPATCTLRDAILAANAAPGSTIQFQSGLAGTYQLSAALPAITVSTTITGNSDPGLVVVAGSPTVPALSIQTGAVASSTVTISGFTVANTGGGSIAGFGSGLFIYNPPTGAYVLTVDVTNMVFSNNAAGDGGAITVDGTAAPLTNGITLNVVGSTFTGNTSTSNGGAIWNGGALTITSSTFSANSSLQGAGIYNCNDGATCFGSAVISDSTFANNTNPGGSGTIYNANVMGAVTVHDSTFSSNSPQTGGSIANAGTLTVTNTVFVNASPGSGNQCTTATTGCPASPQSTADTNGDLQDTATNLKIGSLTNNGGLTQTLLPQTGSPALCGGTSAGALTVSGGTLTADQRGFPLDPNCGVGQTDSGSVQVGGGTITVTTLTDDSGTPAGNAGNCPGVNCSLRDAIAKANGAGTATINFNVTGTITLGAELPLASGNIVINGPGAGSLTLSGAGKYRILENYSGSLTVSGVTFDSANSGLQGGAFVNAAFGTLNNVAFTNNTGTSGGAIYSIRTLIISGSTFSGNSVGAGNGGAIDTTGTLQVYDSTFNNNTAGQGAAIYDESDTKLPIYYSTFANNTNSAAGTLTTNSQSVMVVANDTFFGNTAATEDQDIYHNGGSLTVTNSIIGDANGCGTVPDPACTAASNVQAGVGLTLSALGNYGGPTNTLLPLPGSTAICSGLQANIPVNSTYYQNDGLDQRNFSSATPGAYGCAGTASDAGSVQTNYTAVAFNAGAYTASQAIAGATPQVIVSVTENGQNVGGIPLTLTTGGTAGTPTGTTATTVGGTGATFSSLTFPNQGTGTVAESLTVVGTDTLTAGPFNVVVGAGGTTAVTVAEVAPAPASFVVSTTTAATETLQATVTGTPTVNEGYVSFTVHQHTAAGAVVGTPVTGIPVASGTTAYVQYTIPAPQTPDTYYVVATYTDPGGTYQSNISDSTRFFTIVPAVTATQSIASKVLTVNQPAVNFTPVTGSGGVAPLAYSVAPALPGGLTMSTSTGAITGTPTGAIAATVFTVTVKDANNNQATNTFTLTVNSAVTAVQSIATVTLTQGNPATPFTPVTGGGGTAPLGYTIAPLLPTGLTLSASTGQIAGTPSQTIAATVFTVTVTDANLATMTNTFTLTVNGTLTAVQSVPAVAFTNGHPITPVTPITATGGTAPLTFAIAPGIASNLIFSTTTGQITGTPNAVHATSTFTVTITDANNATDNKTFTLTVNPAVSAVTAVPTTTLTAGHLATPFTPVTATGGTGALTYSVAPALPGLTMAGATGQITGTPTASPTTVYTVTATDTLGATNTATFSLTVNAAISATTAIPTTTLTAGAPATPFTPVTATGGTGALTYTVAPGLPGLTMAGATGQISGTPTASPTTVYTVTATDTLGATGTATFSLTVNGALQATTAVPTTTLTAGHAATPFTPVTATGGTTPLAWSVAPGLPGALGMSTTTGQITGTAAAASPTTVYTVTVKDANNVTSTATFSLTVNAAVSAVTAIPATTLTAGAPATPFTPVTATGGTGALTYTVAPGLPGLTMAGATGQITGTPTASATTVYTVTATDTLGATSTATFSLTVNPALSAATAIPTTTLTAGHAATPFTPVTATGGTAPLAFSVAPGLPGPLAMSTTTGQISGTAASASPTTVYTVTVTDANNVTKTATFSLTVNAAISAVTAVPTTTLTAGHAATPFTPVTATGGTGALTYTVAPALPGSLLMTGTTGQITGTAASASPTTVYTVTATDTNGATATATFSLTVNGAISAVTAIPTTTLTAGSPATAFTPVTATGGTGALTYTVAPALPGLTMAGATGQISGTPTTSPTTVYTVTATDTLGATGTATFSLTVNGALVATTAVPTTTLTAGHAATPFTPVTATGGTTPLAWSVAPGLPGTLGMSTTTGQITGTAASASPTTVYTVTVKDANNVTSTATFSLTVNAAISAITAIPATTVTAGHAVTPFTPVTATGGTGTLHYAVAPALPGTLLMSTTTGQITGTAASASPTTTYTVTVTDANGATGTATFSLTVSGSVTATTAVASTILTENHLATPFSPVTGAGGTAPLAYSVAPALPSGLLMSTTTGQITGTPSLTLAATTFTVTVTDANNATATATFSLTVNATLTATTAVPTTTLLAEQLATPFTPVTGAGGTTPLAYSVAPALPTGLAMSTTTGQITGTPTVTSNATVYTVTVTDANSATATATFSLTVNSAGISITWANPAAITYGTSLTGILNATVTYQGAAVPGTFVYTSTPGGTVTAATVLAAGSYTLTANFTPTDTTKYQTPPAATVPLTVNQGQPILKWTPATTIGYGTSLSALLNATVSFGGNTVAGTFAYAATPTGGTASAVTSGTILPEGTYTLVVTFTPTDATDYKTATATSPLTVTGQTLTVTANNATKVYGTANPTFTGSVTGAVNGDTFAESFTTTATTTSNAGTYPIVPSVTGANLSNYTVVVDDGTLTVSQAGTTITLTASGSSVNPGTSVTLTATVASATTGTPTGIVTFYDGSTALGTGTLATGANGDVATFSTSSLLSGTHTITAVYAGDTNFTASSTSSSITITVAPLGFTLNVTPPSNTGNKGTTFTYNLAVAPAFAGTPYPGTVSFAANGGPAGAVITFTPSTLAASAGPQTVSMSVATSANAALQPLSTGHKLVPVAFALFLLPLAGTRRMRRNGQRLGRFICLLLLALAGVAATTALSGCGSNAGGTTTVNKGTQYTITVTATSGSVTQNAAVTLTLN